MIVMACALFLLFSTSIQSASAASMPDGVYINGPTKKFFSMDYVFANVDIVTEELNTVDLNNVYFYQANQVVSLENAFEGQDFADYVEGDIPAGSYIPENSNEPIIVGSVPEVFRVESIS